MDDCLVYFPGMGVVDFYSGVSSWQVGCGSGKSASIRALSFWLGRVSDGEWGDE